VRVGTLRPNLLPALLAVAGALELSACRQPEQPPLPPSGPINPTDRPAALAEDDNTTDASITSDAWVTVDAAFGIDAGVPQRR
jgi:hypothetical protein